MASRVSPSLSSRVLSLDAPGRMLAMSAAVAARPPCPAIGDRCRYGPLPAGRHRTPRPGGQRSPGRLQGLPRRCAHHRAAQRRRPRSVLRHRAPRHRPARRPHHHRGRRRRPAPLDRRPARRPTRLRRHAAERPPAGPSPRHFPGLPAHARPVPHPSGRLTRRSRRETRPCRGDDHPRPTLNRTRHRLGPPASTTLEAPPVEFHPQAAGHADSVHGVRRLSRLFRPTDQCGRPDREQPRRRVNA